MRVELVRDASPRHRDATESCTVDLLDALLANSAEAIVTVDEAGEICYVSPGASLLMGYDSRCIVGDSVFGYLHPADVDTAAELFARRIAYAGPDLGHEMRILHAQGRWLQLNVTATVLEASHLGVAAVTMRTIGCDDSLEHSLRQRLVVEEFCSGLSARFLEAVEPDEVFDVLDAALSEAGLLTGAETAAIFTERLDRGSLECLNRWTTPGVDVAGEGRELDLDLELDRAGIERLLTKMVIEDDLVVADPASSALGHMLGATSLLSSPFTIGRQRGVFVLLRSAPGPRWTEADAQLVRNVGRLIGRAMQTARAEEMLKLTYQHSPIGFSIRSWDGEMIDCNQQYLDLHGLTREEAESARLDEVLHPDDVEPVLNSIESLRRGDITRAVREVRVRANDGWIWIRANALVLQAPGAKESFVLTSVEDITERRSQRDELEYAAAHDTLTGVANRSAMLREIDRHKATHGCLPNLLIFDLDRFKLVNDSLGHMVGDDVLRAVVARVCGQLRGTDLVARLGGDEFAVVVPGTTAQDAYRLAERLRRSLELPLEIRGCQTPQTISIGVAIGEDCADSAELMVRADRAMYSAKAMGRNRRVMFDESMADAAESEVEIERELRHAIDHGDLEVHFQPEFSLETRDVVGAEALLRWRHPERGLIAAGAFIEVAETTGMIDDIGRFVIREACRSFAAIVAATQRSDLMLRVNISGREFSLPELPERVRSAIADSGLSADRLCLEMTETTVMDAPDVALETFERLHEIGVEFAIDDFGTGHSSLVYLKRFAVDVLKIDRSFVEDIESDGDSRAIVESIISLCGAMSLQVVAEGIETEEQLDVLRTLGVTRGQGYLVAPALDPEQFVAHVASVAGE